MVIKKKRVGGAGKWFFVKSDKPNLNDEINDFLLNNFTKSKAFFSNISTDYFKKYLKNYFSKDKINLTNKVNFHNREKWQYNNPLNIEKDFGPKKILSELANKNFIYKEKDEDGNNHIFYFNDSTQPHEIGHICFKDMDKDTATECFNICHKYYELNIKLFSKFDYQNIIDNDIKIIKRYTNIIDDYLFDKNDKDYSKKKENYLENYKDQDTLETFYRYIYYIKHIDVDNKELIEIDILKNSQKKCGKTDKYLLKQAVIYNIGVMLDSIQYIISESDD